MTVILIGALLIGLTLGMLGSGGSAITVPVLVYLVGHSGKVSIAESMAIVGLIAVAAAIPYGRSRQIDWRSAVCFGLPGMLGTYLGAWLGGIVSDIVQLVAFGCVLLAAAYSMLGKRAAPVDLDIKLRQVFAVFLILLGGFVIVREGSRFLTPRQAAMSTAPRLEPETNFSPLHDRELAK